MSGTYGPLSCSVATAIVPRFVDSVCLVAGLVGPFNFIVAASEAELVDSFHSIAATSEAHLVGSFKPV